MAQPKSYTISPISGLGTIVSLVPLAALIGVLWLLLSEPVTAAWAGAASFLAYRLFIVRMVICRDHRRGIQLCRAGQFAEAITAFRLSEAFFARHPALDRFRALLLASSGPYAFQTLARYNQAYCLSRLKRGPEALAILDELLAEDPRNTLAQTLKEVLTAMA